MWSASTDTALTFGRTPIPSRWQKIYIPLTAYVRDVRSLNLKTGSADWHKRQVARAAPEYGGLGVMYALRGAAEDAGATAYLGSAWRLPLVVTTLVVIVAVLTEPPVRFEYLGCAALFALGAGVGGLFVSALWIAVRRRPE